MTAAVAKQTEQKIARPLHVLVPLIKADLKHGDDAAENAGRPHYVAAGEKLIEAKAQLPHGEFTPWLKRNFDKSPKQAQQYMSYARSTIDREKRAQAPLSSLHAHRMERGQRQTVYPQPWHAPVKEAAERAQREAARLRSEELTRQQERDAERKLANQLIDIGFKVLASRLHPDKGGTRDAMSRLNRVRARLKQHA